MLTELAFVGDTEVVNHATVASTGTESRLDNNDDEAVATADLSQPTGTLPRTGAAIGTLVLLGLALVTGGRLLQRRASVLVAALCSPQQRNAARTVVRRGRGQSR